MGHDIFGYRIVNKKRDKENEIAYLRRSMWSDSIEKLYAALGVPEFYAGVSGSGEEKDFTLAQITEAKKKLTEDKDLSEEDKLDYVHFLTECEKTANKEKQVTIYFG